MVSEVTDLNHSGRAHAARKGIARVAAFAAIFLVATGAGYRAAASALDAALAERVELPRPIKSLPMEFGEWVGEEVPLSEGVQKIAGNDDYINRIYRRSGTREAVNLYVAYTGRPRTMLRHRPTVCFPNSGHSHLGTEEIQLRAGATTSPALVHSFMKPGAVDVRTLVLNYYVLGGDVTVDEDSFWGVGWRSPNLARDAGHYVAQVQIATNADIDNGPARRRVTQFAEATLGEILELLPKSGDHGGP